ncbi:hypothetical protein RRG08_039258 [Elysia crispata]|uniref:Fibrinogen C-terminal domain-containing protein n=1 Tax=Elysia crispata TaxID=231223 RepID=A0AAE0ZPL0_9GAST|nr:hypothetical protein RRG08_039258 [Elysia crispata]
MARNLCVITALFLFVVCHGLDLINITGIDQLPDSEKDEKIPSIVIKLFLVLQQLYIQSKAELEKTMEDKFMFLEERLKVTQKEFDSRMKAIESKNKGPTCERNMNYHRAVAHPMYIKTYDTTINKQVLCDTYTDKGGWIIIQRRTDGQTNFFRTWNEYKNGFGDPGNFWLGNEALHQLTVKDRYEIRIVMREQNEPMYVRYASFRVEAESDNYRLKLGKYIGNEQKRGYGLSYHNNQQFSTRDRDNDADNRHCARVNHGGWWYNKCHRANLNGLWGVQAMRGMHWKTGWISVYPDFSEMKIRKL